MPPAMKPNPGAMQPRGRGGGAPLVAGNGKGQGMHASHRHTDVRTERVEKHPAGRARMPSLMDEAR